MRYILNGATPWNVTIMTQLNSKTIASYYQTNEGSESKIFKLAPRKICLNAFDEKNYFRFWQECKQKTPGYHNSVDLKKRLYGNDRKM